MRVARCVCAGVSYASLKKVAASVCRRRGVALSRGSRARGRRYEYRGSILHTYTYFSRWSEKAESRSALAGAAGGRRRPIALRESTENVFLRYMPCVGLFFRSLGRAAGGHRRGSPNRSVSRDTRLTSCGSRRTPQQPRTTQSGERASASAAHVNGAQGSAWCHGGGAMVRVPWRGCHGEGAMEGCHGGGPHGGRPMARARARATCAHAHQRWLVCASSS